MAQILHVTLSYYKMILYLSEIQIQLGVLYFYLLNLVALIQKTPHFEKESKEVVIFSSLLGRKTEGTIYLVGQGQDIPQATFYNVEQQSVARRSAPNTGLTVLGLAGHVSFSLLHITTGN